MSRECHNVLLPRALVEIHGQKPAGLILQQRIDTHHVPALKMIKDRLIAHGRKRLIAAVAALAAGLEMAEFGEPFV